MTLKGCGPFPFSLSQNLIQKKNTKRLSDDCPTPSAKNEPLTATPYMAISGGGRPGRDRICQGCACLASIFRFSGCCFRRVLPRAELARVLNGQSLVGAPALQSGFPLIWDSGLVLECQMLREGRIVPKALAISRVWRGWLGSSAIALEVSAFRLVHRCDAVRYFPRI